MDASIFFKSKVSEKTYLYDFNTNLLVVVNPILELLFKVDKLKEKDTSCLEEKDTIETLYPPKEYKHYIKKYQYLKEHGFFKDLPNKHFFSTILSTEATEKGILDTQQIIFEVTDSCNLNCKYCGYGDLYNNHDKRHTKKIDIVSAIKLLDFFIKGWKEKGINSLRKDIYISFYGGEPLTNFIAIKQLISYIETYFPTNVRPRYSMTTNGLLLQEHIDYLIDKKFNLLISLDGNEYNNSYRSTINGKSSFNKVYNISKWIKDNYSSFFQTNVEFNAVLHNRNSAKELLCFFQKEFGKIPSIGSLNPYGINPCKKEDFNILYKSLDEDFKATENRKEVEEAFFLKSFQSTIAKIFSTRYLDNSYSDYTTLLQPKKDSYRLISNGSCIPFSKRILMTVNNKLLPCERIGQMNPLGYIQNGEVIINKIAFQKYSQIYNKIKNHCTQCYLYKSCPTCIYCDDTDNSQCPNFTNYTKMKEELASYISLFEEHRTYYKRFIENIQII